MYDDLLLKYITVAGISWRQSNCDSRDVRKLCETDFSREAADPKVWQSPWEVIGRSIDEVTYVLLYRTWCRWTAPLTRRVFEPFFVSVETFFSFLFTRKSWENFFSFSRVHFRRQSRRTRAALPEASVYFDSITRRSEAHETCPRKCQTTMKIRFVWTEQRICS